MKVRVFEIVVVTLFAVIIIIQLTSNDVGRYELNDSEGYVFDSKTGKIYGIKEGVFDILEIAKEQTKRKKQKDSTN